MILIYKRQLPMPSTFMFVYVEFSEVFNMEDNIQSVRVMVLVLTVVDWKSWT